LFYNTPTTTPLSALSLHDALPICPRIPRYNRLGEETRRTAVIAATGMKSAGVENTSVTNHTAMRLDARRAAMTAAKTKRLAENRDRKSTRLNSSHDQISYAVFCLK